MRKQTQTGCREVRNDGGVFDAVRGRSTGTVRSHDEELENDEEARAKEEVTELTI